MRRAAIVFGCIVVVGIAYACGDADNNPPLNNSYGNTDSGSGGSSGSSGNNGTDSGSSGGNTDSSVDAGRDYGTDQTKFFGTSRCATAGVLLCDGFETGTLDTTTWTASGAAPTIDKTHAARGAYALHIQRNGNGQSYIKETKTFPVLNNTYFGRAFVWFHQLPTNSATAGVDGGAFTYSHWSFVAASGTKQPGEIRLSGQMQSNGKSFFGVGTDTGTDDAGSGDWTTSDNDPAGNPTAVPTDVWMCIEWEHNGANNETRFYWNATEHPSLHTTKTVNGGNGNPYILPDFTQVWIGWQEYQTTTEPFEMWVDEVAIDTSRIGCVL